MSESQKILGQELAFCAAGIASGLAISAVSSTKIINRLRTGEGLKVSDSLVGAIGATVTIASFAKAGAILEAIESIENEEKYYTGQSSY